MEIKCQCSACSGKIAFDSTGIGIKVQCPHCLKDTILYDPEQSKPRRSFPVDLDEGTHLTANGIRDLYTCPICSQQCAIPKEIVGQPAACPTCGFQFTSPPSSKPAEAFPAFTLPPKLPFFKGGRQKLLCERLDELLALGPLSGGGEDELNKNAIALGLSSDGGTKLLAERFMRDFDPIKREIESTFVLSDDHLAAIHRLEAKYHTHLTLDGNENLFRSIYLLESTGQLPEPIATNIMLDPGEAVYSSIFTTWHQTRSHSSGYSGIGVSIPSGIKGVRFRFGNYVPNRVEEMTALSDGELYVTTKRLLFCGHSRNTAIPLKKVVNGTIYSDALKLEKNSGKPDLFSMNAGWARYTLSLISVLKQHA